MCLAAKGGAKRCAQEGPRRSNDRRRKKDGSSFSSFSLRSFSSIDDHENEFRCLGCRSECVTVASFRGPLSTRRAREKTRGDVSAESMSKMKDSKRSKCYCERAQRKRQQRRRRKSTATAKSKGQEQTLQFDFFQILARASQGLAGLSPSIRTQSQPSLQCSRGVLGGDEG